ncbi:fibronectin type III domain-containing protein [Aureimonas altamirensis]|uniref:host specificity factor TipJ family phage tail protein n=1 Tax=Aureimonas altamirensis TaxID=370622 RepID=UPI002036E6CE|nr:host specificity factor TipJ family phage tail protein [Aureimonas altamirensis]MCM2503068.1 fibronectin type III domain-containing protein [Aureimonas altamirensis]
MSQLTKIKKELETTIYSPADTVKVIVAGHPLRAQTIEVRVLAGLTIAEIIDQAAVETHISDLATSVVVYIDGVPVPAEKWERVRPKKDTTIVLRAVAEGPLFAGIGALFSAISASVFTAAGGLTLLGKVGLAVLSVGAKLLLNALFPIRQPQLSNDVDEKGKQAFSITGSRNTFPQWQAIPVVLGQHRVTPVYGAQPYTENHNDDQYFRGLFVWCYGPATVHDIRVGETPLSSFQDVQIDHRWGNPGDGDIPLFPGQVIESQESIDLEQTLGWVQRTTATGVTEISADIVWPSGLYAVDKKNGTKYAYNNQIEGQYRLVGTANWASFPLMNTYERNVNPIRRTFRQQVAEGQYEIRIRRLTTDDGNVSNDSWTPFSKTILSAFRGARNRSPITYPKQLARTAIRMRASQQLNGSLDSLNGIVTAHVYRGFNGTSWVPGVPSRNPADLILHVMQGPANARPIPDSQIDFEALQQFWWYCHNNGYNYDKVITNPMSIADMVAEIAHAGRAVPMWKDGRRSLVWDEQNPPIVQSFTPDKTWNFNYEKLLGKKPQAFKIRFINRDKGWIEDERIVYNDGFGPHNTTLEEAIEFPGVTDAHNIWRHGRFQLAQLKLRPEQISFNTDWSFLRCTRGDRVRFAHDTMLIGQAWGRIVRHEAGFLYLSEPITVESGKNYRFRWETTQFDQLYQDFYGMQPGEYRRLPWTGPVPTPGESFTWGELGRDSAVFRVLAVEPSENLTAKITLVADAPEISLADRGVIPPFNSNITRPVDPYLMPPSDFQWSQDAYQIGDSWFAQIQFTWAGSRAGKIARYEVAMVDRGAQGSWRVIATTPASQPNYIATDLENGIYAFRVRAIFENGTFSNWLQSEDINTTALTNPPDDVTNFNIASIDRTSTLSWNSVANASYYEIRFAGEDVEPLWNNAAPLKQRVSGVSETVPTMVGFYMIKAVKANGVRSRNATMIRSSVGKLLDLNVIEVLDQTGFTGDKFNTEIDDGFLRLLSKNVIANWTTLAAVPTMADGIDGTGSNVEPEGYYYFDREIDLDAVYTSRITASFDAYGVDLKDSMANWSTLFSVEALDNTSAEDWSVELQVRVTNDDPLDDNWSEWKEFVVGDVTARAFQFRLHLTGSARLGEEFATVTPYVKRVTVNIDMPDRMDSGRGIVAPASGRQVTFEMAFAATPAIIANPVDINTNIQARITNETPQGFFVQFFNSSNTAVPATFNWHSKGYGAQLQ